MSIDRSQDLTRHADEMDMEECKESMKDIAQSFKAWHMQSFFIMCLSCLFFVGCHKK